MVKYRILKIVKRQFFLTGFFLFCTGSVLSGAQNDNNDHGSKVKEQAIETYESLKHFTLEQKQEALTAAEEKLEKLDAKIDEIQDELYEEWQEMDDKAREKKQQALKTLRTKRKEAAEWYGGVKHSSIETWGQVKKGLIDSLVRLQEAIRDAGRKVLTEKKEGTDVRE